LTGLNSGRQIWIEKLTAKQTPMEINWDFQNVTDLNLDSRNLTDLSSAMLTRSPMDFRNPRG